MSYNKNKLKLKDKRLFIVPGIFLLAFAGYWATQIWLGPQVAGVKVVREDLVHGVTVRGQIEAPERVEITSKTGGTVTSVAVTQGQLVRAGQTLIVLESREARAAYDKARVATRMADAKLQQVAARTQSGSDQSLQRAQNTLNNAKKQYSRTRELSAKGFVSQDQLGDALRNLAIAQNQLATAQFQAKANRAKGSDYMVAEVALNKARSNERALKEKLNQFNLKALSGGIVTSSFVEPGSEITPDKTLMVISTTGKTGLTVLLDKENGQYLTVGQSALVTADSHPDQRINAKVAYLNHDPEKSPASLEAKLDIDSPPEYLRRDMPVSAEIEFSRREKVLSMSVAAIRGTAATPWVMLIENGRTQRRIVKLGIYAAGKVEILEGLREGDFVLPATETEVEEGKRMRLAIN